MPRYERQTSGQTDSEKREMGKEKDTLSKGTYYEKGASA